MENNKHKGTELNNISETWDQNERNREAGNTPAGAGTPETTAATGNEDLDQVIKAEASEYDRANKEDRILGGERATLNDDPDANAPDA